MRALHRSVAGVPVVAALAAGALALAPALPAAAADPSFVQGRFDRPQDGFSPATTTLHAGTPGDAGLDAAPVRAALSEVRRWSATGTDEERGGAAQLYPGAVAVLASGGTVVAEEATGLAVQFADATTELPADEQVPMRTDTVFDMASVSKLFTSIALMQQVEAGRVDLDAPVITYLPEFAVNGKEDVTIRQLLTHTGGLPAWAPLWSAYDTPAERLRGALAVAPVAEPGTQYLYSDLGMITIGAVVERVTGQGLDDVVREGITEPLGMTDTGYNPTGPQRERAAATEYQASPPRGVVRGEVHDENAWSLGGVAGHAGVFSTAHDMSVLARALLNGGVYDGARVLSEQSVVQMLADENTEFPGDDHGLGFELDQRWYMDGLSSLRTAGHTGFTGTSLVLDYPSGSFALLLTNRVHPTRDGGSVNPARRAVARGLAQGLRVSPQEGPDAWSTTPVDSATQTLEVSLDVPPRGAQVTFDALVDVEDTDPLVVEASGDGGQTWLPVGVRARGHEHVVSAPDGVLAGHGHRRWWQVQGRLPVSGDDVRLRWRYTTDALYQGRGVVLDDVEVAARGDVLLDGEATPEALTATGGWHATS